MLTSSATTLPMTTTMTTTPTAPSPLADGRWSGALVRRRVVADRLDRSTLSSRASCRAARSASLWVDGALGKTAVGGG